MQFRSPLPELGDLQKFGSALTYQKRYVLASLFVIAGQEDDDANSAERVTRISAEQAATLTELGDTLDWDAFIAYCRKMKWVGHADGVESMLESNYPAALNALQKKLRQQHRGRRSGTPLAWACRRRVNLPRSLLPPENRQRKRRGIGTRCSLSGLASAQSRMSPML